MLQEKRVIALIPARGGSKRLPKKNVLPLAGIPLIAWTIKAALSSDYIDEIVVTTDCLGIAAAAKEYGAEVPFIRPAKLSSDTATTNAVLLHAIEALGCSAGDVIVLLQPTSPLRTSADIDGAIELLHERSGSGVVSVCECDHSPLWTGVLPDDGNLGSFISEELTARRSQDLPKHYRLNGAIYAFTVSSLLGKQGIHYSAEVYAFKMDSLLSIDIDTEVDFKLAEAILTLGYNNHS